MNPVIVPQQLYEVTYSFSVTQLVLAENEKSAEEFLLNTPDSFLATLTAKHIREGKYYLEDCEVTIHKKKEV